MKVVNLKSLLEIYDKNGSTNIPPEYMNYLGGKDYELKIKNKELNPLKSLITTLENIDSSLTLKDLNSFYIGYKIPQIGKEFDLLRISEFTVLNIEYKREAVKDKIKQQALRNNYYLKFLDKEIKLFIYIEKENAIYTLNESHELIQADYQELIQIIKNQCSDDENFYEANLNELFNPCNYLISPFRKTAEFIRGEYFLTQEQEEIEKSLLTESKNGGKYFFLTGEAGSGKTLLTYHIAKKYMEEGYKVGLIHCAKLNAGHNELKEKFGWNIQPIKHWESLFNDKCPAILIIDEIQRINEKQFWEMIRDYIKPSKTVLIMCGDEKQTLSGGEGKIINSLTSEKIIKFKLNSKIRTNKELSSFIKIMLDLGKKQTLKISDQNIDIVYFATIDDANRYISTRNDYSYISYTPSMFYKNRYADSACWNPKKIGNSHEVIGQEFENVIVVLGEHFYYNGNKLKAYKMDGIPYAAFNMFFQQITRAINKLEIVVVNNIDVFNKLIEIFE
ncbi:MAG: ATP-binding protein [Candidatus Gastranaerophilales bacterium]|nr:ATP-binding protein [Candidatus Gastranaerophilales bacterium]